MGTQKGEPMITGYLAAARGEFQRQKEMAERAMVQTDENGFFAGFDEESNSIAVIVKHIAGNLRSRWRDFLTSDGEKPDRDRDTEFEIDPANSREELMDRWESAWKILFATLDSLTSEDMDRLITIRGEKHHVWEAIMRQLTHYAYHVGQIVYLARQYREGEWQSLSIPRNQSEAFNRMMAEKESAP